MRQFFISSLNRVALLLYLLLTTQIYKANSQNPQMWWANLNGGANSFGTFSSLDITGNNYQDAYSFSKYNGHAVTLTKANNGKIYGIHGEYEPNISSNIFELNPLTGKYTKKITLPFSIGLLAAHPLVADQYYNPSGGKLYGSTTAGGADGFGSFFEFDDVAGSATKLFDNKSGRIIKSFLQATNGKIYGVSSEGFSIEGYATSHIFEYDISSQTYTVKLQFRSNQLDDIPPARFMQHSNGKLYAHGIYAGYTPNAEILYEYDIKLNTLTETFLKVTGTFDYAYVFSKRGQFSLAEARNGKLYGAAMSYKNTNEREFIIYEIDPFTKTLTPKFSSNNFLSLGAVPGGNLTLFSNGKMYGNNHALGENNTTNVDQGGTVYEFDPANNQFKILKLLPAILNGGVSPVGEIIEILPNNSSSPAININDITVGENIGTAALNVCLSAPSNQPISVKYRISHGAAVANQDYNGNTSGTLYIPAGQTCANVSVAINDDNIKEPTEDIVFVIENATNATIGDAYGAINIVDNDETPPPPPSSPIISINDIHVSETSKFGTLFVSIPTAQSVPVTVQYKTSGGIAISGADYISSSGTVTIVPGQTFAPIKIRLINDSNIEPTEDAVINISNPTNAVLGDAYGAINILDDDSSPTLPLIAVPTVQRSPGQGFSNENSEKFVFVFADHINPNGFVAKEEIRLSYYIEPRSAKENVDYVSEPLIRTATIRKGDPGTSFMIQLIDDSLVEPEENFIVRFINPTSYRISQDSISIIIVDNDTIICPPGTICLTNACPATTVNLNNAYSVNNLPAGTSVSWHTGTPATNANKLTTAQAAAIGTSGNYYAAINISGANCYSATVLVTVNIKACTNASVVGNIVPAAMETISKKISIAPNPFANNIQASVQVQKEGRAVLTVMDIFGREVKSKTVQLNAGNNQVSIDGLGKLPAGNYLLRVASGTTVETHKIVKQE